MLPKTIIPVKKRKTYTYALGKGNFPKHVGNALLARGNWKEVTEDTCIESAHFVWKQLNFSFLNYDRFDNRMSNSHSPPLIFNHMEVNRGICTKTGLVRSLKKYYENVPAAVAAGYTAFDSTPTTFVVSRTADDSQLSHLMNRFSQIAKGGSKKERTPWKHCEKNIWIVKPANTN